MTLVKKLVLATALALPASAGLAQGVEHHVLVERWGFFPTPISVQPGDTIVFENAAPHWVKFNTIDPDDNLPNYQFGDPCDVGDPDGDGAPEYSGGADGFRTGWFNIGSERTITITECTETRFAEPEVWQFGHDANAQIDLIIFGEAPNGN